MHPPPLPLATTPTARLRAAKPKRLTRRTPTPTPHTLLAPSFTSSRRLLDLQHPLSLSQINPPPFPSLGTTTPTAPLRAAKLLAHRGVGVPIGSLGEVPRTPLRPHASAGGTSLQGLAQAATAAGRGCCCRWQQRGGARGCGGGGWGRCGRLGECFLVQHLVGGWTPT